MGTTKDIVALIDETRRLELLQQEEEGDDEGEQEEEEEPTGEKAEEKAERPNDLNEKSKAVEARIEDEQSCSGSKSQPTSSILELTTPATIPAIAIGNDLSESKETAVKDKETANVDEKKPASSTTQTIPVTSGKDDLPVESTFMTEVLSMFDGIVSSTTHQSDSGLGGEDGKKSSNGTEYTDSDSDIEEGVIKQIQRRTILTSDLTISRV